MIPAPTAQPGKWYAVHWREQNVYYELQPEMLIRNSQSTDYAGGTYDKAPCGKCVGTILHHRGTTILVKPGKVALDLANLPFPKEYWFFLDGAYQESDLEIFLEPEDMDLTRQMIGEIKMQVLFWLF